MQGEEIIRLEGLTKWYEDGHTVLDHINLTVRRNEFLTLLGPSGCGKTTTLRLIAGFEQPSEGRILFDGQDISHTPPHQRRINTVFQKHALFPHMNVFENVAFGLTVKKLPKDEIADIIENGRSWLFSTKMGVVWPLIIDQTLIHLTPHMFPCHRSHSWISGGDHFLV